MPNITLDLGMEGKGALTDKILAKGKLNPRTLKWEGNIDRNEKIDLPSFGEHTLVLPPFFIVKRKVKKGDYYNRAGIRWRLANPLTEIRTLATRKGKPSVNIVRQADADEIQTQYTGEEEKPTIDQFSQRDQNKLIKYFRSIWEGDADDEPLSTKNKPRGFPAVLYKNAKKAGYKETKEKVYRKNELKPKKLPEYKVPAGRPRRGRRIVIAGEEDEDSDIDDEVGKPTQEEIKVAQAQKKAREKRKTAPPITDEEIEKKVGLKRFFEIIRDDIKSGTSSTYRVRDKRDQLRELRKSTNPNDKKKINDLIDLVEKMDTRDRAILIPEPYKTEIETYRKNRAIQDEINEKLDEYKKKIEDKTADRKTRNALFKEVKSYLVEIDKIFEGNAGVKELAGNWVKSFTKDIFNAELKKFKAEPSGKGLTKVIEGKGDMVEEEGGCDHEGSGGGILGDIGKAIKRKATRYAKRAVAPIKAILKPKETIEAVKKFGKNLIYGRLDAYPPSAQKIIDDNKDAIVQSVELHRKPLASTYTTLLSWATGGEADKRIKEQPKDTLYHISMWVKLSNGKTLKLEKNEVINMVVNPKKHKDEQEQSVPAPPAGLTFGDMLEKARKEVGDYKFFSYSAKDNNCGNWIEYILRANGMESKETKDYIGQDTKTILAGFPTLRKVMNTITDLAGRANVLLEGGALDTEAILDSMEGGAIWRGAYDPVFREEYMRQKHRPNLEEMDKKLSHDTNIDMPSQGGRMLGATKHSVLPSHAGHPALVSDMYPRIPQAFSQVYLSHPRPLMGGEGLYASGGEGLYAQSSIGGRGSYQARYVAPKHMGSSMEGDGFFSDIGDAFKFAFSKQGGRAIKEGLRPVGSFFTHKVLPSVVGGLTGIGTTLLTGNPVAGFAVGQTAGKALGNLAGDAVGKATGTGMKKPRMVKGSAEAKAYMASIRKKKGMKGGAMPPPSRSPITDPSLLGGGLY